MLAILQFWFRLLPLFPMSNSISVSSSIGNIPLMNPKLRQPAEMAGHSLAGKSDLRGRPTAADFQPLLAVDEKDYPILKLDGSQIDAAWSFNDSSQEQAGIRSEEHTSELQSLR